jgi:hypothetical protein
LVSVVIPNPSCLLPSPVVSQKVSAFMYVVVEQIMLVSRFYLVKADEKEAIVKVDKCDKDVVYLHQCDELHWDDKIKYKTKNVDNKIKKDRTLLLASQAIDVCLSVDEPEPPLTSKPVKRKMKKAAIISPLKLIKEKLNE